MDTPSIRASPNLGCLESLTAIVHWDIAEFMNVPNKPDVGTKVQEDEFMDYELQNFW
jgi:hypothetical protein